MDSDDDLPEVSFDSPPRQATETSNQDVSSSPPRASSYSFELAKINAFQKKIEENCQFEVNKAELENLIRKDGYQFDERAQLRNIVQSDPENNELNEGQRHILYQLEKGNEDPIISFKPDLENLFDLKSCRIVFNEYPIEAFTRNFVANLNHPNLVQSNVVNQVSQIVEPVFFFKFLNQIPNETYKNAVLDCLFFNIPWFSGLKALSVCEILSEIINSQRSMPAESCWRITGTMLFKYLKCLGFRTQTLESSLPEVFINVQGVNKSASENSSIGKLVVEQQELETISEDNFKIAIKGLLDLLYQSLQLGSNGKSFYSIAELDLMFVLLTYLFLDETFDLEFSTDHRLIVQLILTNYSDDQWEAVNDKSKELCSYVFKAFGLDGPDEDAADGLASDKSEQLVLSERSSAADSKHIVPVNRNSLYHRIYHLISSLGYSFDKKANKFRFDLAYYSACNLLMSYTVDENQMDVSSPSMSDEDENDKTLLHVRRHLTDNYLDYKHLATMADEKLTKIYESSTHAMYNLIRLLEIIIADIATSKTDGELKIKVLEQFKDAVQTASRCVKDKLEFQGRMQVKILNSNFVSKCEYYLKEFTTKSSKYANLILNENKRRQSVRSADREDEKENTADFLDCVNAQPQ